MIATIAVRFGAAGSAGEAEDVAASEGDAGIASDPGIISSLGVWFSDMRAYTVWILCSIKVSTLTGQFRTHSPHESQIA
jgi:hypothetical protein